MSVASSDCTVVMATFNGAKYLTEQLDSLRRQTMLPRLLIASDDGSTDGTREILESFSKRTNFEMVIVDGPRSGYADNFWSAAKLADTKYLAWSDQDDVWSPHKISRCVQALEGTKSSFVSHSAVTVDAELRPLGGHIPDYRRTRVLGPLQGDPYHVPSGFASLFRRDILHQIDWGNRPFSHQHTRSMGHDHAVGLTAFAFHRRVQLSEPLAHYRQHGSNAQGAPRERGLDKQIATALRTSADDYAQLGSRADGYARYLSLVSDPDGPEVQFFRTAAERARLRERVRDGGAFPARLQSLLKSARSGNYRTKSNGGFGFPAFLNDCSALLLSMAGSSSMSAPYPS